MYRERDIATHKHCLAYTCVNKSIKLLRKLQTKHITNININIYLLLAFVALGYDYYS